MLKGLEEAGEEGRPYHLVLDVGWIGKADGGGLGPSEGGEVVPDAAETMCEDLDIAGTAFRAAPKGGTGRPVPLLMQYLRERAGKL